MFAFLGMVNAQVCVPDSTVSGPGVYPSVLPDVCANQPYSATITLVVPADTTIPTPIGNLTVPIDSIVLDSVANLPPGFTFQCAPPNCTFPGGASYCILVSGTTSVSDTFSIDIFTTTYLVVVGVPQAVPTNFTGYYDMIVHPPLMATIAVTDANCGAADGQATVTPSGSGTFSFLWSNGDTTATTDNLAPGSYTVVVTDSNGCSETFNAAVGTVGNAPSVALDTTNWSGCAVGGTGDIAVNISGGTMPYTFSWSNGATSQNLSGVSAGMYSLTVTDNAGCASTQNFTLAAPVPLTLAPDMVSNVSCYGFSDGSASVVASGGIGIYTYSWMTNPPQNTAMISGAAADTIGVTVTDEAGCVEDLTVIIAEPDSLEANISGTDETVMGADDGSATVAPSGGTSPYTVSWSNGKTGVSIDSLPPGMYIATITDDNGCETVDSVEISAGPVSIEDELSMGIASLSIFPNPSQGNFSLKMELSNRQSVLVRITDLNGREVARFSETNISVLQKEIFLRNVSDGMYLLIIQTQAGTTTRKLIVR